MSMSNGVTAGNFTTLTDLQASKPRVNTIVSINGTMYSVNAANFGEGLAVNSLFANPLAGTTTSLINSTLPVFTGEIRETSGFATGGDGGKAQWEFNGVTGQTPSQTPAQLGDALLNDANGNQWGLVKNNSLYAQCLGAKGDGSNVYAALLACVNSRHVYKLKNLSVYGIATPIDLAKLRDGGFIGESVDEQFNATQDNGRVYSGATIKWVGALSALDMIHASTTAIGVAHSSAFNDSIFGFVLKNVLLDGNDLIDYGLYCNRLQNPNIEHVIFSRTNKHGFYGNGMFNGSYRSLMAFKNNGSGLTAGKGGTDFGWAAAQVNAACITDWWGFSNGYDGAFDETTNPLHGYGVGLFIHRGNFIQGVRAENNDGPNLVFAPTGGGNLISQIYSELANSLDIGGGATAITQGRATQKWGMWYSPSDAGGYGNAVVGGVLGGEYIRITGTATSAGRPSFNIENIMLGTGVSADYAEYRLTNCDNDMWGNIIGTAPKSDAYNINGKIYMPEIKEQAFISFNATTGAITANTGINATVTYAGVGLYDVSITDDMNDALYTVSCPATAQNRAIAITTKTPSGFRINHTNLSGTVTDSSAILTAVVTGVRTS